MQGTHRVLRAISGALVLSLIMQSVSFAAPEIRPMELVLFPKPMLSFELPKSVALIADSFKGNRSETVILLQDAHTNESAQMNIARALDTMMEKGPALQYVFLEAGTGNDSLSFLRDKADLGKRQQIGREFMRKGYLSGSEYLDLTSNKDMVLWGVEDKKLYWEAVESYSKVAKGRDKFQAHLKQVELAIDTLKPRIFNLSLKEFDAKKEAYLKEELSLTDYLDVLMKQSGMKNTAITHYPHLIELSKLKEAEKAIDFKKANEEQTRAVTLLSQEDQEMLKEAAVSQAKNSPFKLSAQDHKTQKAYYALLEEKIVTGSQSHKVTSDFPELTKYFAYLKAAEKIDPKSILEEQKLLEEEVYDSLIQNDDERDLKTASDSLRFLKGLFNLTLTPEEYRHYKKNKEIYSIVNMTGFLNRKIIDFRTQYERVVFLEEDYEDYVQIAERYYQLTYERDFAFLENMFNKMKAEGQKTAALITGGYHTPNLTALLRDKGISYIVVTPQVLQETNIKKYEQVLLSQKSSELGVRSSDNQTAGLPGIEGPQALSIIRSVWPYAERSLLNQ